MGREKGFHEQNRLREKPSDGLLRKLKIYGCGSKMPEKGGDKNADAPGASRRGRRALGNEWEKNRHVANDSTKRRPHREG